VFAILPEGDSCRNFLAAVIGEVFSFMVVQPWLRFPVLAIYSTFTIIVAYFTFLAFRLRKKIFAALPVEAA
jgi:hypothetical protein